MFKQVQRFLCFVALVILAGCGGGGEDSGGSSPTSNALPTILYVNKDGLYRTSEYRTTTNILQNSNSGYFISNISLEWLGKNMGYTAGYVLPTSGTLDNFTVSSNEVWYSISNANLDLSKAPPTLNFSSILDAVFANASESKIVGSSSDDKTIFYMTTSEVDLQGGVDTLEFSQNFSAYKFQKVLGQPTSLTVQRSDMTKITLIKNVELFKFNDGTRTLSQIIASIP